MNRFVSLILVSSLLYFAYFALGRGIPGDSDSNGNATDGKNNDSIIIVLKTISFPFDLKDNFDQNGASLSPLNISQAEHTLHARDLPPHEFEMLKTTLNSLRPVPGAIQADRLSYFAKALNLSGSEILELKKLLENPTASTEQLGLKSRRDVKEPPFYGDILAASLPEEKNQTREEGPNETKGLHKSLRDVQDPSHYENFSTFHQNFNTSTPTGGIPRSIEDANISSPLLTSTPDLFINFHNQVNPNTSSQEKI